MKQVFARQLEEEMKRQNLTKTGMSKQMQTSRAQSDRLITRFRENGSEYRDNY